MLPLARALGAAGHDVAFASGEPIFGEAEADGFTSFRAGLGVEAREQLGPEMGSLSPAQIRSFMFRELFVNIELGPRADDLMEIVEAWRPHIIVHEVAEFATPVLAASLAFEQAGNAMTVATMRPANVKRHAAT
jgi:hypothetical protein